MAKQDGTNFSRARAASRALLLLAVGGSTVALAACGGGGGTTTTASPPGRTATTAMGAGEAAETIFQQNCSSCHVLAAAKATFGEFGPNLDQLKPSEATVKAQVEKGGGTMPAFGKDEILTSSEIEAVSEYVATEAGR